MIAVVSHAWLLPGESHARAYQEISARFTVYHRGHPGFRGRRLLRGHDDPSHLINLRYFDSVADYERLVATADYPGWIAQLSEHVQALSPVKEYLEVVLDDVDPSM